MFCVNCGTQLPDDANFCSKCGQPCRPDFEAPKELWEECVIEYEVVKSAYLYRGDEVKFVARAVGPAGDEYTAGESATFQVSPLYCLPTRNDLDILNELIDKLVREGWEKTGKTNSDFFWEYTFKRKISG